jgi:hypothetical protein
MLGYDLACDAAGLDQADVKAAALAPEADEHRNGIDEVAARSQWGLMPLRPLPRLTFASPNARPKALIRGPDSEQPRPRNTKTRRVGGPVSQASVASEGDATVSKVNRKPY